MSATKRNNFWQRVLKKNEELNASTENAEEQNILEGKSTPQKGNWIKKLGTCSPSKYQVPRSNAMKTLERSGRLCNAFETPRKTTTDSPPLEMPDLESIIRDFEMGYLSPSKSEGLLDTSKQKNFVKKIVAAFEVKYKTYNDLKTAQENQKELRRSTTATENSKRRSGIFSSPFRNTFDDFKSFESLDDASSLKGGQEKENRRSGIFFTPSTNNSMESKSSRRSGIFDSPFKMSFDEERDTEESFASRRSGIFYTPTKDSLDVSKSSRQSRILSSFNPNVSKDSGKSSDIYMSPVKLDQQDSKDLHSDTDGSIFTFDKEESGEELIFQPLKVSSLDETKDVDSIDFDVTLPEPEETIFLEGYAMPKTSTMIDEFTKESSVSEIREVSNIDKTPKIVGAFLKKPIEIEDTSINWIPITGKKLPRKRSLKKLLSSLTGKKTLVKRSKMFSSERNLCEETRELQDSGYDERSCSSSSVTSLISITEVLLQQENSYVEPRERTTLKTFQSKKPTRNEENESSDTYSTFNKQKKLCLTEVPREDVKLDLGPTYPPSLKMATMSLDRRAASRKPCSPSSTFVPISRLPKHPNLSKIPKHPFVALTKMDEPQDTFETANVSMVIKNDLYEVEFRRSWNDICTSPSSRSSLSAESNYDVPRKFLSKSETELSSPYRAEGTNVNRAGTLYDVPRTRPVERPRSSLYEDALSVKRRSVNFKDSLHCNFYAPPFRVEEPHYATVKPRNFAIRVGSSLLELHTMEKCSVF